MIPKKPARLVERKLGRSQAAGLVEGLPDGRRYRNAIHVDPRQEPQEWLDTAVHELIHIAMPILSEDAVIEMSRYISSSLWSYGVRRVQQ